MEYDFNRKAKRRMVGVRLTEDEYKAIKNLAHTHKQSIAETVAVLIRAALKDLSSNSS